MTIESHDNGGRRSVLIVHGRSFKPTEEYLAELSLAALRAGVARDFPEIIETYDQLPIEFAYYGDLTNRVLADAGRRYDETLDVGDRRNALGALREIQARKRFGIRQYDRLPGKSALPEFIADVCMPMFARVGLTVPMVSLVAKDFATYLQGRGSYADDVRARVRDKVVESLARGDQLLLITHGTGAAVAWDVLWQLSHDEEHRYHVEDRKVDLWLTLGAPLGDGGIRKRLAGAKRTADERFPTNVISWCNVSAEDDYTCHDKTLADDFKRMMRDRIVSAVTDHKVYNHAIRYGRSNPHSSIGYYIHPRVSKVIADWIRHDATAVTEPTPTPAQDAPDQDEG